jgi:hypothetical protein
LVRLFTIGVPLQDQALGRFGSAKMAKDWMFFSMCPAVSSIIAGKSAVPMEGFNGKTIHDGFSIATFDHRKFRKV